MRIGLIAMSGIRVCDEELLRLGLTLPGFVERSRTIASLPSLGLLTLAGMTPPHHELEYIEVADLAAALALGELPDHFDLVAISSLSAQVQEAYRLADHFRLLGIPTIMGGIHATSLPEEVLRHCTSVVVGEGELSWPAVLRDAESGTLRPRYGEPGREFDMAEAPMPAFHLLETDRYNRFTVQTSRGCPHRCDFCASSILLTGRYKQKPAAKILAEIDRIRSLWDRPFIEFADDNTFIDRRFWKALLPEIAKRRIRWFTETDVSIAEDSDLLHLMRESGCAQVLIGLESPTAGALDGIELRGNWKMKQWAKHIDAVHTIQSHGVSVNGCLVIGLDGHGPEVFDDVIAFVREAALHEVQITIQTPFPGTPLWSRLRREDRLLHEGDWSRCTLFDVAFKPLRMSADALRDGFRNLMARLYTDEATRWRREQFRKQLRHSRSREVIA